MNTLGGNSRSYRLVTTRLKLPRSGSGSTPLPFTLNGVTQDTPYTALLPVGQYTVTVPAPLVLGPEF